MIKEYTIDQCAQWEEVVESFDNCDIYFHNGYACPLKVHGDGEPLLLYYESGELRGINVVMKRDIADNEHFNGKIKNGQLFDFATPYGYGGWIFEGEQNVATTEEFRKQYLDYCKENRIVSEFVRFHPLIDNVDGINKEFYNTMLLGNTVSILLDNEEYIWQRFSSKNRGHIRMAIKSGVTVRRENTQNAFEIFKKIYKITMDHDAADSYYYFGDAYFESIKNNLEGNYSIFTAYLEDVPIATSIMLYSNHFMHYHLSGQLFDYRKYSGTSLILYEAAKWGCNNGYKKLHLGGGVGAQDGSLYVFKKSFNTREPDNNFYIGRRIYDQKQYDDLIAMRENISENGFFPKYRS